jgi:beta-lactam-binding protein with PASTA domain
MKIYNIYKFITGKVVIRNLILALILTLFILLLVFKWLNLYTRHNMAFSVPDFYGLTISEVKDITKEKKLRYVVFDSVYINDLERGTVVDQHPKPDFKVKKHRKIFLTMNAVNPEKTAMPDLVNLTLRQALSRLESYGLKAGKMIYEPDLAINEVLAQRYNGVPINKGDTIVKGSKIDLVIGKGLSNKKTAVPSIIGYTLSEAQVLLSGMVLKIGKPTFDSSVLSQDDSLNARIINQIPGYNNNELIPLGSSIDVWLTVDSALFSIFELQDTLANE